MDVLESIQKLKELTERIPTYNPYFYDESRLMHLICEEGSAYTIGVYKDTNISIAKTIFSPCTSLGRHTHNEKEVVFVLEGELTLVLEQERRQPKTIVLRQYDSVEIPQGVPHHCHNTIGTTIIANTMPGSKYFPEPYEHTTS